MATPERRYGGLTAGGILVIVGIIVILIWSFWIGLIIALIGLIGFGGFVRGKWYYLSSCSQPRPRRLAARSVIARSACGGSAWPKPLRATRQAAASAVPSIVAFGRSSR
jgi:hypothetical protein